MSEEVKEHIHSSVDIRTVTAPILTLLSMAGLIVWATTSVWEQKQQLKDIFMEEVKEVRQLHNGEFSQLRDIVQRQTEVIASIRERQHFILDNLWTKQDHVMWCKEVERKNVDTKWTCPDYETLKELGLLGSAERYGINNGLSRDNEIMKELKRKMEIERKDDYNLWNRTVPRHDPDAPKYRAPQ